MDINNIAASASAMTALKQSNQVQLTVLKKSLDIEQQGAMALIAALPPAASGPNLPANLGQHVNTTA